MTRKSPQPWIRRAVLVLGILATSQPALTQDCFRCDTGTQNKNRVVADELCNGPGETGYRCVFRWAKDVARCVSGQELRTCVVKEREKVYATTNFAAGTCERADPRGRPGFGRCGRPTGGAGPMLKGTAQYCEGEPKQGDRRGSFAPEIQPPDHLVQVVPGETGQLAALTLQVPADLIAFALTSGEAAADGPVAVEISLRSPFPGQFWLAGLPQALLVRQGNAVIVDPAACEGGVSFVLQVDPRDLGEGFLLELQGLPFASALAGGKDHDEPRGQGRPLPCPDALPDPRLGAQAAIGSVVTDRVLTVVGDFADGCPQTGTSGAPPAGR